MMQHMQVEMHQMFILFFRKESCEIEIIEGLCLQGKTCNQTINSKCVYSFSDDIKITNYKAERNFSKDKFDQLEENKL